MVAGLNEITGGAIYSGGKGVVGPGPDRGIVFQSPCLLPWLTAFETSCWASPKYLHRQQCGAAADR